MRFSSVLAVLTLPLFVAARPGPLIRVLGLRDIIDTNEPNQGHRAYFFCKLDDDNTQRRLQSLKAPRVLLKISQRVGNLESELRGLR